MYNQRLKIVSDNRYPLLVTLGFFIIVLYVSFFHHNYWIWDQDGFYYLSLGKEIINGNGQNVIVFDAPIAGLVFYAFLDSFFNNGFVVLKIISIVCSTAIIFVTFFIIRNIFESKIALLGQLFLAFNPSFGFFATLAEIEMLPLFLMYLSLYFVTKKLLQYSDMIIIGSLLGISYMFRYSSISVLVTILIFSLLLKKNKLHYFVILLGFFILVISPTIILHYTNEVLSNVEPTYYMFSYAKYKNEYWIEQMKESLGKGFTHAIFADFDLFIKNYLYNLFYNIPAKIFNFNEIRNNASLIPAVPFVGIIPIAGGLFFVLRSKQEKTNLKPLLLLPIVFAVTHSIVLLYYAEQYFIIWIFIATISSVFFIKIYEEKSKLILVIVITIFILNTGYEYVFIKTTSSGEPFRNIKDEFSNLFNNEPLEAIGIEVKTIGDVIKQHSKSDDDYVMANQFFYSYYTGKKQLYGNFNEGPSNDKIENYIMRKNWKDYEIFISNAMSFPIDRKNIYNPIPDFVIYDPHPRFKQHEYLKILENPNHPDIPSNFEFLYKSERTNIVVYKIHHD